MMARIVEWWGTLASREKAAVASLGVFLILVVLYLAAINPALTGRARLAKALPRDAAQLSHMEALALEARRLASTAHADAMPLSALAPRVTESLRTKGLGNAHVSDAVGGIQVRMDSVLFGDWVAWADSVRTQLHVVVVEAHVGALHDGLVSVDAVLAGADAPR